MTWQELRQRPDIIAAIDWDMTPAQAFEVFQLKSAEAWRHRGLEESLYFYLSVWRGEARVLLVRRSLKDSQELAEAPAPPELVQALAASAQGQEMPRGQIALDQPLKDWLRAQLGL